MDQLLRYIAKIPGALMVVPLFFGAIINTLAPEVLEIGSFTTALFKDGTSVLIAIFFVSVGSQISFKTALPLRGKRYCPPVIQICVAALVGVAVAFLTGRHALGALPLAVIAAMSNSSGSLFVALTSQFGSKTDKGSISILSINDGPFLTMIALGAAGLADFLSRLSCSNLSNHPRLYLQFIQYCSCLLAPGEKLIIPFVGFSIGAGIDFNELVRSGAIGVLLGLMTLVFSGTATITCVYLWHRIRRHPRESRNLVAGAAESAVAGNAIATPAAIAAIDPSLLGIQAEATAQIATAVVVTTFLTPFLVSFVASRQRKIGITPEAEDRLFEEATPDTSDNESESIEHTTRPTGQEVKQPEFTLDRE